ncbi:MAG TPA: LCP family protein [Leifsonia sp.]|nr:LCP family protein [Leifsonia sp.]
MKRPTLPPDPPAAVAAPTHDAPREKRSTTARRRMYLRRRIVVGTAALVTLLVVGVGAYAVYGFVDLTAGIHRSDLTLPGSNVTQNTSETNILIMGLDSRLDENGDKLPQDVYNALHAGSGSDGGYNANVLMLIHIPAGGGKAVGISIPRDDYVALAGSPDGVSHSKIKEAYGLALDQKLTELMKSGKVDQADAYQQARATARQTEITTVSDFLGGVPINHFLEVTMAAFYQVAEAVQPITVCVAEATQDPYSGANFPAGVQQLTASQAVSFVRQRRDEHNPDLNFTDLDRERRQQAFIVSLATKLKKADTFTNIGTLQSLIDAAKQNIAIDSGLNLLSFASQASQFAGGNITFTTLPITGYGVRDGKDVNLVDLNQIHATVRNLLHPASSSTAAKPSSAPARDAHSAPVTAAPGGSSAGTSAPAGPTAPLTSGGIPCVK